MDFLFGILLEIYPSRPLSSKSSWIAVSINLLLSFFVYLQSLQFLWHSNMAIPNWTAYQNFWMLVSAPGIYRITDSLGLLREFAYVTLSTILCLICVLIILSVIKLKNKTTSPIFCLMARILFELVSNICFIPIFFLLLRICLNTKEEIYRDEFENSLDFGESGKILAGFGLALVGFLTLLFEGCHFEMRPQKDELFMFSKIDSKTDLCIKGAQIINCLLVNYLSKSNQEKILLANVIMNGLCAGMLIMKMPYYSKYFIVFRAFLQLSLALTSLFFLIGYREQNATVILVLYLIMQPLIAFLTYSLVEYRVKKIALKKVSAKKNFSTFELSIRPDLRTGSDKTMLKKLNENYIESKDRKNKIITAYYCNDILNDCSLGLNKISNVSHRGFNIPLNYQIFKCKKFLLKLNEEHSLIFRLDKYLKTLIEIKEKDKEICLDYFKFFAILLKKNQSIDNLKNSVFKLMSKLEILDEFYVNASVQFHHSKELKEMYGSFLSNIKGDSNQGQEILGYNWKITGSQMNNFNRVIKEKFLLMISAEPKTYGKVKFMNREFSLHFKYNHLPFDELSILSLFPTELCKYHEKILVQFADKSISTVLYDKTIMFLLDSHGYAHECIARAEFIVLEDSISLIISVDPLNKNREYAIITNEGKIIEHSKKLSRILNIKNKRVRGFFIQEFLPELSLDDTFGDHSDKNLIFYKKYKVILKKLSILKTTFNILYFIDDFESNADEAEFFSIGEKDNESVVDADEITVNLRYESEKFEEITRKLNLNEKNSKIGSQSSTAPSLNPQEINCFKKSIALMNISKVILLILILFLISSNLGILGYLSIEVEHSITSHPLANLNYLSYGLSQCALVLRSRDIYNHISEPQYFSDEYLGNIIDQVNYYQEKIDKDLNSWKYCSSSSIVTDYELSYWDLKNVKEVKKTNLFNYVDFILENVKIMQVNEVRNKMKNGENYEKQLMNVISNTIDGPFDKILGAIDQLVECEKNRISDLENKKTYLMLAGAGVIGVSVGIIFCYFMCSDKHLNNLWERLRLQGLAQGAEIRRKIKARVFEFHTTNYDILKGESKVLGKDSKKFSFRHSFRFFYKFSPLFIIAVLFLLITTLHFYAHLKDYLYYRPYIVSAYPRRRVQMSVISFLIQESFARNNNYSIQQISPDFYPLPAIELLLDEKVEEVEQTGTYINSLNTKALMSDYLYNRIFYKIPEGSSFLSAGAYRAVAFLNNEAIFYLLSNKFQTIEDVEQLIDKMIEFDGVIKGLFKNSYGDSKDIIKKYFKKMIAFVTGISVSLLFCYLIIYHFVLCGKIAILTGVVNILKMIPKLS